MSDQSSRKRAKYISCSSPPKPTPPLAYSFCESSLATSNSPWHIRPLDDAGRKLGGGITTASLCELVQPRGVERGFGGWDLNVEVTEARLKTACKRCVAEYLKLKMTS